MTVVCPECKGRCCRNQDFGYRVEHMGAEFYEHVCEHCFDGDMYVPPARSFELNGRVHRSRVPDHGR